MICVLFVGFIINQKEVWLTKFIIPVANKREHRKEGLGGLRIMKKLRFKLQ